MILSLVVYLGFLLLLVITNVATIFIFRNKRAKIRTVVSAAISCFLLWILFSFKGINTGSDTMSYYTLYNFVKTDSLFLTETLKNPVHYEVGFLFFMSLIAHTTLPYLFFQMFIYLIICSCLFYSTLKLSKNPCYSIFIFFTFTFYNFFISGLRQALSISLCLLALSIVLARKKDWVSFLLFFLIVAIACSMHNSAFLFFPVVFFANVKMTQKRLLVLILGTVVFYIFGFQLYNVLITAASMTNLVYVEGYVAYSGGPGKTPILMLLLTLFSFVVLYPTFLSDVLAPKLSNKIKKDLSFLDLISLKSHEEPLGSGVFILLMFFGCCFEFLNRFSSGIGRGSMYFTISLIFLLPNALENFENKTTKYIVQSAFCLGFIAFLFYYSISTNIMNFQYEFYF